MHRRLESASDALDRAFEEGLTGHVVVGRDGKRVTLEDGSETIEFVSCSYLGLETHPRLVEAAHRALDEFGLHLSSSRNRMRPRYLGELEALLREVYAGAPVCVFTSTSSVHLGVLPVLGANGLPGYPVEGRVEFLVDRTAHASMQVLRGILDQLGPTTRVDVAETLAVEERLAAVRRAGGTPILLVDGVGSMSGLVPVVELADRLAAAGGYLYVDDAHGISIDGPAGAGWAFTAFGGRLPDNVVLAGSLSKAFGGSGGFAVVAGDDDVRALRTSANPLVFGHSIMLPMLAADVAAAEMHLSGEVVPLQERLWSNIARFDDALSGRVLNEGLRSPVRGVRFAREAEGLAAARRLRAEGIIMLPAFYPTVEQGSALLRFAISALHTPEQIDRAAAAVASDGTTASSGSGERAR
ncbi:aminotransferase class I/II-fold pyridoxal phosphate-dependent enzyme [Rathayibacter tanaceti]